MSQNSVSRLVKFIDLGRDGVGCESLARLPGDRLSLEEFGAADFGGGEQPTLSKTLVAREQQQRRAAFALSELSWRWLLLSGHQSFGESRLLSSTKESVVVKIFNFFGMF